MLPLVLPRPRPTVLPLASLTLAALTRPVLPLTPLTRSLLTLAALTLPSLPSLTPLMPLALTRLPLTGAAVSPGLVSSRRGLTRRP